VRLEVNGEVMPPDTQSVRRTLRPGESREPFRIRNLGDQPLYRALTVTGIPLAPATAEADGFRITRRLMKPDGSPADLAAVRQNDQLMAVIEGEATIGGQHRTLVVDLLPAGLELENVRFAGTPSVEEFAWLGELATPVHVDLRDDRYVAALDLSPGNGRFRLAYLVRAVTPGSFVLPGSAVEDMYQPHLFAREAAGRLTIAAR
jgi:uncharacterized protein YfaS (alpha-2-macroglobulin family)